MAATIGKKIIKFYTSLENGWKLPEGIELLYPFSEDATLNCIKAFYTQYFNDNRERTMILGINPGRFGAGVTGVPFTDPWHLKEYCDIDSPFPMRKELSAIYIHELIEGYGGISAFYGSFFISSVCPLGFTKNGININYYDEKMLQEATTPYIIKYIEAQLKLGFSRKKVFILGKGKNYAFFKKLNKDHNFFDEVIPLPHPRWVMQYRRKYKEEIASEIQTLLSK